MKTRIGPLLTSLFCLLLLGAPAASAQISSIVPGSITVLGEGSATAPADFADIAITVGPDTNVYMEPLSIESTSAVVPDAVDVSAVVDAIIAQGVPVNDVEIVDQIFSGEWGSNMTAPPVTILVRVPSPTVDGLADLLDIVRTTAHAEGLYVNQFGVVYGVHDCRALRQEARVNAVANARLEAEDQAAALETSLGSATASRDTYPINMVYYNSNSCTPNVDVRYAGATFDPGVAAEVQVIVAVEVSFEIP